MSAVLDTAGGDGASVCSVTFAGLTEPASVTGTLTALESPLALAATFAVFLLRIVQKEIFFFKLITLRRSGFDYVK